MRMCNFESGKFYPLKFCKGFRFESSEEPYKRLKMHYCCDYLGSRGDYVKL